MSAAKAKTDAPQTLSVQDTPASKKGKTKRRGTDNQLISPRSTHSREPSHSPRQPKERDRETRDRDREGFNGVRFRLSEDYGQKEDDFDDSQPPPLATVLSLPKLTDMVRPAAEKPVMHPIAPVTQKKRTIKTTGVDSAFSLSERSHLTRRVKPAAVAPRSPAYSNVDLITIQKQRTASLRYLRMLAIEEKLAARVQQTQESIRAASIMAGGAATERGTASTGGHPAVPRLTGMPAPPAATSAALSQRQVAIHERLSPGELAAKVAAKEDAIRKKAEATIREKAAAATRRLAREHTRSMDFRTQKVALEEKLWEKRTAIVSAYENKLRSREMAKAREYNLRQQLKLNGVEFEQARNEILRKVREDPDLEPEAIDAAIEALNERSARILGAVAARSPPPVAPVVERDEQHVRRRRGEGAGANVEDTKSEEEPDAAHLRFQRAWQDIISAASKPAPPPRPSAKTPARGGPPGSLARMPSIRAVGPAGSGSARNLAATKSTNNSTRLLRQSSNVVRRDEGPSPAPALPSPLSGASAAALPTPKAGADKRGPTLVDSPRSQASDRSKGKSKKKRRESSRK